MAKITLRQLLDDAAEYDYGVPAFNINNMEQGLAILKAAAKCDAPVILQVSRGARAYANDIMLSKMMDALVEMYPAIPVCIHQDHGNDEATCLTAIRHGFTSVMMDGSLESGQGEAEDGHGAEGVLSHDQLLTDPDQAVDFVRRTGVDALAIAMGTSHGAYKFTRQPDGDILAMGIIEEIHRKLPNTHLVMHGSSSVPQALQDVINRYGGEMPQTWGVPVEEIVRGIRHGVRKVNIDTDCRMAMAGQFRKIAVERPQEFDPRKFLQPAMDALTSLCTDRNEQFGTAGKASKITAIPLDAMARRYQRGELEPETGLRQAAA